MATSQIASGREVPVDHERVAEIHKALEDGTYPLIPTEIADAIIASRLYGKVG
ncbi:MAG: flagellar biosynthesis anti-sigma factor FlgM [Pseudomonadota bacterium]|nr:flagellar biosynthesis anti-sigma factor FlgM [Pseudomonadota bacterium]